jgi:hypothetical protein
MHSYSWKVFQWYQDVARSTIVWEISRWQTKQTNNLHKYILSPMTKKLFDKCLIAVRSTMFDSIQINKQSLLVVPHY